jgi:thioesterase domain-containing protein/acyl carrier protein
MFVAARNHLEHKLVEIWEEALDVHPIGIKDNFFDLDGDSLLAVQIFGKIEKQFGQKLPLATIIHAETIEEVAAIITKQIAGKEQVSWSSLVKIQPNGAKSPLFLMHPLGGEIIIYRKLSTYLGFEQPIYGLQPVGLDGNTPYTKVEDMAAHYIQDIQTIQPHGPYLLGGYSFGGIIALEIAQQLLKLGEEIAFLLMLDTCRPGYSKRVSLLKRIPIHIKKILEQPAYIHDKFISMKTWSKFQLQERYKLYTKMAPNFINIALELHESDEHMNIMQANALALSQYSFQQKYSGQLTLFRTADENRDDNAVGVKYDPEFGWKDIFLGGIDIHHIPGSHLTLFDEPNIELIAQKLKACLAKLV